MFRVFLSVHCSHLLTCLEKADLLALLCVMFYCVFVTFQCGVLGQVWCLIVSFPDICFLSYFYPKYQKIPDELLMLLSLFGIAMFSGNK